MADGDTVKLTLTFWRDGKEPGDIVEVPADEVHRWKGYAKPVSEPKASGKTTTAPADTAKAK